jgi:hypothetical protein
MPERQLTDAEQTELLRVSLLNIGRLLPEGMQVCFTRDPGCAAVLELIMPDGQTTSAIFRSASPLYAVPAAPAERWFK